MEQLDEEHAALQYVREKAELLLSEAKVCIHSFICNPIHMHHYGLV